ncbi:hypothetical protein WJX81_007350 [Elliptochloris bilobata]|uniref:BRCT domain-containing protein n=1 Tax=Elliptochloris bilobata TaxID=381761 RepID=A0AAW1RRC5_9CHLO
MLELIRICREGAATRHSELCSAVTHIVVGADASREELDGVRSHLQTHAGGVRAAKADWLRRCGAARELVPMNLSCELTADRLLTGAREQAGGGLLSNSAQKCSTAAAASERGDSGLTAGGALAGCWFTLAALVGDPVEREHFRLVSEENWRTPFWVDLCQEAGMALRKLRRDQVTCRPLAVPVPLAGMQSVRVSASGMDDAAKATVKEIVKHLGGKYTTNMTRQNTHLVLERATGQKFFSAPAYGVLPVTPEWLLASADAGKLLPEADFCPLPPLGGAEDLSSTAAPVAGDAGASEAHVSAQGGCHAAPLTAHQARLSLPAAVEAAVLGLQASEAQADDERDSPSAWEAAVAHMGSLICAHLPAVQQSSQLEAVPLPRIPAGASRNNAAACAGSSGASEAASGANQRLRRGRGSSMAEIRDAGDISQASDACRKRLRGEDDVPGDASCLGRNNGQPVNRGFECSQQVGYEGEGRAVATHGMRLRAGGSGGSDRLDELADMGLL